MALREERFDSFVYLVLLVGLAACPFWLGSNRPVAWGVNAVIFPSLLIIYEIGLIAAGRRHPFSPREIVLPIGCFAAVAAWIWLQSVPFTPEAWHYPIWSMTSGLLGRALPGAISVNPDLTTLGLVRFLTAGAVFWLALQLGRDPRRAVRLLEAVALIGALYAAYGVISFVLAPDRVLWFTKTAYRESVTSTFINRNNFATYSGVTLVACIGVVVSIFRHALASADETARTRFTAIIIALGGKAGYFLVAAFVISVALVMSGSRGGVVAAFLGLLVLGTLIYKRTGGSFGAAVFILIASGMVATLLMYGELVAQRLGSASLDGADRLAVYELVMKSIFDSPLLGFGYASFLDIFPLYRDTGVGLNATWDKAHNVPLEIIHGLGIPAAFVLFVGIGALLVRSFQAALSVRRQATPCFVAVAASAVVLFHGLFDFGLQIQAITLTWCALLGAGVAQSQSQGASGPLTTAGSQRSKSE